MKSSQGTSSSSRAVVAHARENSGSDGDETIVWKTQEVVDVSDDQGGEIGHGGVGDLGEAGADTSCAGDDGMDQEVEIELIDEEDEEDEEDDDAGEFFEAEYEVVQGPAPWAYGGGSRRGRGKGAAPSLGGRVMVDEDGGLSA